MTVEDEQGWVPSTCLEREDGVKEEVLSILEIIILPYSRLVVCDRR